MKPIILVTPSYMGWKETESARNVTSCSNDYINAITLAGGTPLILPYMEDEGDIEDILTLAHGILFSGGVDVHPKYFNEPIIAENMTICDGRDIFELKLAGKVLPMDIPLLGICRGMQLLNIALGGNIYQDIDLQYKTDIEHSDKPGRKKCDLIHKVRIEPCTRLGSLYGSGLKEVNSFHHQTVKDLAPSLKAAAYSEDGLLEACEAEGERFLVATQWHPEMLAVEYPEEMNLFKVFIENANSYRKRKK
ncbi:MAG: gamma-glutamyl-gamma-aminobutyrate hydrolase family protein [Pseudomonadota bacterium]